MYDISHLTSLSLPTYDGNRKPDVPFHTIDMTQLGSDYRTHLITRCLHLCSFHCGFTRGLPVEWWCLAPWPEGLCYMTSELFM